MYDMRVTKHLRIVSLLVNILYNRFGVFKWRTGFYALVGLIPGVGDIISLSLAIYIFWIAYKMQIPKKLFWKMLGNVVFDLIVGLYPIIGDLTDAFYRSHFRNVEILKRYAKQQSNIIEGEIISPPERV